MRQIEVGMDGKMINPEIMDQIVEPDRAYYRTRENEDLTYGDRTLPSIEKGIDMIEQLVLSDEPFMVARLGETEQRVVAYGVSHEFPVLNPLKQRHILNHECANWCEGAGFFPRRVNLMPRFTELYLEAFRKVDVLAVWELKYEQFFLQEYMPEAKICRSRALAVVECEKVWTRALRGKKVLVISPFAKSIEAQYKHREHLHRNLELLPEFELKTIKAVQSPILSGRRSEFRNWFQALDWMYNETLKIDYDVALLGCGAYAFPLAAKIKESGHGAITTCGGTQLIFGIMGKRWDTPEYRTSLGMNQYWVYPSEEETPRKRKAVENGCYWR